MKSDNILIVHHLGLGDHIICNALYRELAKRHDMVCLPVKYHNCASVEYMLRNVPNCVIRPVEDDADMMFFASEVWKHEIKWIGNTGPNFIGSDWDVSFYQQAGVEFSDRWTKWECPRDGKAEDNIAKLMLTEGERTVFIHEDSARGLQIDITRVQIGFDHAIFVTPGYTNILFHWRKVIEACDEIHCIPSSFAAFIDSIPLPKNPKLFLHHYTRANEPLMKINKNWTVLT
jgi:hypothetical protein